MALAVSVLSSGMAVEPVAATIADLEPLLPAPIIGLVPGKKKSFDPLARRRLQIIDRWIRIFFGGLMLVGCMGGIYWFFAHLG